MKRAYKTTEEIALDNDRVRLEAALGNFSGGEIRFSRSVRELGNIDSLLEEISSFDRFCIYSPERNVGIFDFIGAEYVFQILYLDKTKSRVGDPSFEDIHRIIAVSLLSEVTRDPMFLER